MRVALTALDAARGTRADVLVSFDEGATVHDVARSLQDALAGVPRAPGGGGGTGGEAADGEEPEHLAIVIRHPRFMERAPLRAAATGAQVVADARAGPGAGAGPEAVTLWVDGRTLAAELPAGRALRDGMVVALGSRYAPATDLAEPTGVIEVRVTGGPAAGSVHRLGLGRFGLGRDRACAVVLGDPAVAPHAATVTVGPAGATVAPAPGQALALDGSAITAASPWPAPDRPGGAGQGRGTTVQPAGHSAAGARGRGHRRAAEAAAVPGHGTARPDDHAGELPERQALWPQAPRQRGEAVPARQAGARGRARGAARRRRGRAASRRPRPGGAAAGGDRSAAAPVGAARRRPGRTEPAGRHRRPARRDRAGVAERAGGGPATPTGRPRRAGRPGPPKARRGRRGRRPGGLPRGRALAGGAGRRHAQPARPVHRGARAGPRGGCGLGVGALAAARPAPRRSGLRGAARGGRRDRLPPGRRAGRGDRQAPQRPRRVRP